MILGYAVFSTYGDWWIAGFNDQNGCQWTMDKKMRKLFSSAEEAKRAVYHRFTLSPYCKLFRITRKERTYTLYRKVNSNFTPAHSRTQLPRNWLLPDEILVCDQTNKVVAKK